MLEKMDKFFNDRLEGYDKHQLNEIESAEIFYPFTAKCLPVKKNSKILDLGCGTGLELEYYFKLNPTAKIVGIDLAKDMLEKLKSKFLNKNIELIQGSYFNIPFKQAFFDAVVSVESLHHFTKKEKSPLYKKIFDCLKPKGYFILTDYLVKTNKEETLYRKELARLKKEQGIKDGEFYHYDTPLTVNHEIEILKQSGFTQVEILGNWENTYTIKACK